MNNNIGVITGGIFFTLLNFSLAHATNPASKEYVDQQISSLRTEIASLPLGVSYVPGTGISIVGNVISATSSGSVTYTIGQAAQGGIIFYLDASKQHGLAAANADEATQPAWDSTPGGTATGAKASGIYLGSIDQAAILASANAATSDAAIMCNTKSSVTDSTGTYGNWYLPSTLELQVLYINRVSVGIPIPYQLYWSSIESSASNAQTVDFSAANPGGIGNITKATTNIASVRCIRSF